MVWRKVLDLQVILSIYFQNDIIESSGCSESILRIDN